MKFFEPFAEAGHTYPLLSASFGGEIQAGWQIKSHLWRKRARPPCLVGFTETILKCASKCSGIMSNVNDVVACPPLSSLIAVGPTCAPVAGSYSFQNAPDFFR